MMNQPISVRRQTIRSEAVAVALSVLLACGQLCSLKKSAFVVHLRADHTFDRLA